MAVNQTSTWSSGWFATLSGMPITGLANDGSSVTVEIGCSPTDGGLQSSLLTLQTNDASQISIHYTVRCNASGPVFASDPPPTTTIDFGSVGSGERSAAHAIQLNNTGYGSMLVTQVSGSHWFEVQGLPAVVIRNSATTFNITCTPPLAEGTGVNSEQLVLRANSSAGNQTYTLRCTSIGPKASTSPVPMSNLTFVETYNRTAHAQIIAVTNTQFGVLQVGNSTVHANGWFSIVGAPVSLSAGRSANITVRCLPPASAVGQYSEWLHLPTNDATQPTITYALTCTALQAHLVSLPSTDQVVAMVLNSTTLSGVQSIRVRNDGNVDATLSVRNTTEDGIAARFSQPQPPSTTLVLGAGATGILSLQCTLSSTAQSIESIVTIETDAANIIGGVMTYRVLCQGAASGYSSVPLPNDTVSINAPLYVTSSTDVVVSNTGNSSLDLSVVLFRNHSVPVAHNDTILSVSIAGGNGGGGSGNATLAPLQRVNITVRCTARSQGSTYDARLVIATEGSAFVYHRWFTAVTSLRAETMPDFGNVLGGKISSSSMVVHNDAAVDIDMALTFAADQTATRRQAQDSSMFTADSAVTYVTPSRVVIPSGGSATVVLSILPTLPYSHSLPLYVATQFMTVAAPFSQAQWSSIMSAIAAEHQSGLDFGSLPVGDARSLSIQINNTGNAILHVQRVSIANDGGTRWLQVLAFPTSIAAQSSAPLTAECSPRDAQAHTTTVVISSDAPSTPQLEITVRCSGTATCSDGFKNQDETGVDCGGTTCAACVIIPPPPVAINATSPPPTVLLPPTTNATVDGVDGAAPPTIVPPPLLANSNSTPDTTVLPPTLASSLPSDTVVESNGTSGVLAINPTTQVILATAKPVSEQTLPANQVLLLGPPDPELVKSVTTDGNAMQVQSLIVDVQIKDPSGRVCWRYRPTCWSQSPPSPTNHRH
jgi:hypothetical protein